MIWNKARSVAWILRKQDDPAIPQVAAIYTLSAVDGRGAARIGARVAFGFKPLIATMPLPRLWHTTAPRTQLDARR
ncbi:hypothetical protein PZ897_14195 [Hoeflea sp. YIM 152468]|uniref:hypothetical protein n=1 Tax=Hoeflea sp. YIM 152468 TaxID=3031759 RepID=UPI0023D99AF2|nr:hypothetical protein [Hoeflea sp. YIM 152468]MDF1609334.1 hypothetical protein [Hoeflea sp. YIM 152468]